MTGIQFITDDKGRKTAAVIDLKKQKTLWEDIQDVLVSKSRRHEKSVPFDKGKIRPHQAREAAWLATVSRSNPPPGKNWSGCRIG
jgi:hypothetical protein